MSYLKPQSPLKIDTDYIYPITTYDQIINKNGNRVTEIADGKNISYLYSATFSLESWFKFFSEQNNEWQINRSFMNSQNLITSDYSTNFSTYDQGKTYLNSGIISEPIVYINDNVFYTGVLGTTESRGEGTYCIIAETNLVSDSVQELSWSVSVDDFLNCKIYIYEDGTQVASLDNSGTTSVSISLQANTSKKIQIIKMWYTTTEDGTCWETMLSNTQKLSELNAYMSATSANQTDTYNQTVSLVSLDGGTNVSNTSIFASGPMCEKTADQTTNETLQTTLNLFNTGYSQLGNGTATSYLFEKPTNDIEVIWSIKER